MRWSRATAVGLGLLQADTALAGACCVGSTSSAPASLGECERWGVGLGFTGETRLARWDGEGRLVSDSLEEQALVSALGAGWRWSREGHLTAEIPLRWDQRSAGDLSEAGLGVGDLRLTAALDPWEEDLSLPPPVFRLGVRLPTGRSWEESESPLQSDVTGLPGAALAAGVSLERTLGEVPWTLGVAGELPVAAEGAPALLSAAGSLGRYLGTDWTVSSSLRYERTLALHGGEAYSTARTTAGLKVIHGQRLRYRAWLGAGLDLPVPALGLDSPVQASASLGAMLVR